jgi:hypothetical protein
LRQLKEDPCFNGSSSFAWNGNSFADLGMSPDGPIRPVAPWKLGISQAAMMRGTGAV